MSLFRDSYELQKWLNEKNIEAVWTLFRTGNPFQEKRQR